MLDSAERTPDLRSLHDTVLKPRLAALEQHRLRVRRALINSLLLIAFPVFMVSFDGDELARLVLPESVHGWIFPVSLLLLVAAIGIAIKRYALPGVTAHVNYRARFKKDVVAEIFRAVMPRASYSPDSYIKPEIFHQSAIFNPSGNLRGDDLVRGHIGGTPFEACELSSMHSSNDNKKPPEGFHGIFFHIDFNKTIHGHTIVQPQNAVGLRLKSRSGLSRVALEDPVFEARFEVYSSNPVEARYILTPALMERIVEVQSQTDKRICLAFVANRAFVAVHYGRQLFEPAIATTTSYESIARMADNFRLAELVVHELDLNTRIWTKDIDARLLNEAAATSPLAELSSGDVTVSDLLDRVYVDTSTGDQPVRPAGARSQVEHFGDRAVIRYRFAWWTWLCLILSAGFLTATVATVLPWIARDWVVSEILPALDLEEPVLDSLQSSATIILGMCVVIGGFISLYWITYVRRVVIDDSFIRIKRGLSPFAHYYPRGVFTRVLQADTYLYLGRTDETRMINPSLSPMLKSTEEASWLAWEIRRAFERIARRR
jgi:hypothetical protein